MKFEIALLTDIPSMQAFITNHERALEELFGDVENHRKFDACLM